MREISKQTLRVQLFVQLFNQINSWFLQSFKLVCIGCGIINGYVGVRFGHTNLLIAIFCAFVHASAFVGYCGAFQRAYHVRKSQVELKKQISAASGRVTTRHVRREVLKMTNALRCTAVDVGGFHEIERNSALIFIDYVERQLMGLLVAL